MNDLEIQDQALAHDDRNRQILATLASKGVDLSSRRSIDLYFATGSQAHMLELMAALKANGLVDVRVNPATIAGPKWTIEARTQAAPQDVATGQYTRSLVRLALAHEAVYDGWGTEV
jgi:hypothetical protein